MPVYKRKSMCDHVVHHLWDEGTDEYLRTQGLSPGSVQIHTRGCARCGGTAAFEWVQTLTALVAGCGCWDAAARGAGCQGSATG